MTSKCKIVFENNENGVYYAGQTVSGSAELITTRPKTIRLIYINISGFSEVRWTEDITKQNAHGKDEKAMEQFSASELYYSSEKCVYGQHGGPQIALPAAKYVFPFQATIPPNAPTSFNGIRGQIAHVVTLVIDRVLRYDNTFKQSYTVISPFDLNLQPHYSQPLEKMKEKKFFYSCCGLGAPMSVKVTVPFSAYAPGQKIGFNIVVDNQSSVACRDVKVRLMKKVTYTCNSPTVKTEVTEMKIADNHCGDVMKHNKAVFNESLEIPSTTPTSMANCSLIKIEYILRFIAKFSFLHSDLIIDFPFIIGTMPLHNSCKTGGIITSQPSISKIILPSRFSKDLNSEIFEGNTFKPSYPMFSANAKPESGQHPALPTTPNNTHPITIMSGISVPKTIEVTPTIHTNPSTTVLPSPSRNAQPESASDYPKSDINLEVLGFSIPPNYQPTATAPKI